MICANEPAKIAGTIENTNAANNLNSSQNGPQYC